jgi:hypothetical protein
MRHVRVRVIVFEESRSESISTWHTRVTPNLHETGVHFRSTAEAVRMEARVEAPKHGHREGTVHTKVNVVP